MTEEKMSRASFKSEWITETILHKNENPMIELYSFQ